MLEQRTLDFKFTKKLIHEAKNGKEITEAISSYFSKYSGSSSLATIEPRPITGDDILELLNSVPDIV